MPRPKITDHWLGVSAGLIHEEKGGALEPWDSDLGFVARREFS